MLRAMMDAFEASPAYEELFRSLRDIQQRFFANQDDVNLQTVCEELVQSLKCWWLLMAVYFIP